MRSNLEVYRAFFILFTYMLKPRYDIKLQLLTYQVTMLRDRIEDSRIMPTERERAELLRLGAEIDHDISDVMMVVKPATYKGWLRQRDPDRKKRGAGRPGTAQATINLVVKMATENLGWGYSKILGELNLTACEANGKQTFGLSRRDATA
jgi:putative transposase